MRPFRIRKLLYSKIQPLQRYAMFPTGLKHAAMKKRIPAIAYVEHDLSKWSG